MQCISTEILDDNENYENDDEHDFDNHADSSMAIVQNYTNEAAEQFEISSPEILALVEKVRAIVKIF